jgi:arylsulfatase A-like enzyme
MKNIILFSIALAFTACCSVASRPNIIFILTDDLGYSDISCYGAKKVNTPHLDQLAAEGIRFTDFHTGASICSPSRAAFLTGAYPQRNGLYMGINPVRNAHWFIGLNPEEITLAEQLKTKNYTTFMIGKWHLGTEPEFLPRKQGFDFYYGMPCNFSHDPAFYEDEKEVFTTTPLDQLTALYTQRLTQIIRQDHHNEPFFIYYAHNYPHTPYKAGKDFAGSSQDGVRGDIMQELDWSIGVLRKTLEETGQAENTIIIFTSDNGPTNNTYAQPYRGTKYVTFEGGHRVPFIFHWPAQIKKARVSDVPVHAMDLFPTLSAIINAPLPDDRIFDGENILPLLQGGSLQRSANTPFYYYNCENLQAVRRGDWKLHLTRNLEQLPFWEKNKAFTKLKKPVLYNLRTDVGEQNDQADAHPEIVTELLQLAERTRGELGEYMQRGNQQRATGSVVADAPIIGNDKDWGQVPEAMRTVIQAERLKRHPQAAPNKSKRPKKKTR